jgi:hypothetical protein
MVMKHRPTHDYLVALKLHRPEASEAPIIHGVVRVNAPPPHHYAEIVAVGPPAV